MNENEYERLIDLWKKVKRNSHPNPAERFIENCIGFYSEFYKVCLKLNSDNQLTESNLLNMYYAFLTILNMHQGDLNSDSLNTIYHTKFLAHNYLKGDDELAVTLSLGLLGQISKEPIPSDILGLSPHKAPFAWSIGNKTTITRLQFLRKLIHNNSMPRSSSIDDVDILADFDIISDNFLCLAAKEEDIFIQVKSIDDFIATSEALGINESLNEVLDKIHAFRRETAWELRDSLNAYLDRIAQVQKANPSAKPSKPHDSLTFQQKEFIVDIINSSLDKLGLAVGYKGQICNLAATGGTTNGRFILSPKGSKVALLARVYLSDFLPLEIIDPHNIGQESAQGWQHRELDRRANQSDFPPK